MLWVCWELHPPEGADGEWGQHPRLGGEADLKEEGKGPARRPGSPPAVLPPNCFIPGVGEDMCLVDYPATADCRGAVTAWSIQRKQPHLGSRRKLVLSPWIWAVWEKGLEPFTVTIL